MRKITDKDYSLPVIEALSPIESFETGANRPLLIRGVDAAGNKGDYVVKFLGAERMSTEACMRELLAAFIAAQMEIQVVNPVIVNISQDFVDLLKGNSAWQYASKSLGYNYGSEYIKRHSIIIPAQDLNHHQLYYAQTIFAFDVTIQNPDRTIEKPNMLTEGTEIVIYDHELAFSFVMDIFPNPKPWELRQADLEWIGRHCLLPKIKGKEYDFEEFSNRFNNLDENFWAIARSLIPKEWLSDQFDRIKQHFSAICNNKDAFIIELKKLMS
ncbi:MAG TPA: HipA family kinase [Puia sp.]|nr:HipA family kinase [Puia sp.]